VVVAIGALGFWYLEGLTLLEAFYMTITTITTVGYGDITPQTFHGRIFTMGLILAGVGVALYVLTRIIESVMEERFTRSVWYSKDILQTRKL
jgi:voltage-gated potassium channel